MSFNTGMVFMMIKVVASVILMALCGTAYCQSDKFLPTDYTRSIEEVLSKSERIVEIRITSANSVGCDVFGHRPVTYYEGTFIAKNGLSKQVTFCSYGDLGVGRTFILSLDKTDGGGLIVPMDAIFEEYLPGKIFRMIAFGPEIRKVKEKDYWVRAVLVPNPEAIRARIDKDKAINTHP